MNEVIKLIKAHRSIRKYEDKPIDEKLISEIVEAAQWASTSSFVQAYTIIGVQEKEIKEQLSLLCGEQPYIAQCPLFLVFCADLHRLEKACEVQNTVMVGEYTESFIMSTVDAALAAQNAMLTAESLGLGGVYIGGIRNNPDKVSDLLKLPSYVYPVVGMCLGYPAQNPENKPRLPLQVVYKRDVYQNHEDMERIKEYDEQISTYYQSRTKGKRNDSWTQQMAEKMNKEIRPHMRGFLRSKGFLMK